ncbi:OadG family transporter subunit [Shewanella livingstonensis]|uniref:Probable oxaloacetate decarboxylase gamma chain n=1 Tax=Shewanella livingstonensis TaxID=150120 RepID=A0A3G8LUX0_9GAMM|nr:OadG family transporter subunit [Shewanella livingstonensis]AZG72550.1 sodium pump decarboxylase subunit gamma [Shewanella livingstonensis]
MTSISEQLSDALGIMVMGMGLVFIFLSILIIAIGIVAKLFPASEATTATPVPVTPLPVTSNAPGHTGLDPKLVAAITSAIHQYRAK